MAEELSNRDVFRKWFPRAMLATLVTLVMVLLLLPGVSHAQKTALVGLGGVWVGVESMTPQAERIGLTKAQIQTDVELRLRKAGIRVLTEKEKDEMPGRPYLYVNLHIRSRQERPPVVLSLRVALVEAVTLARGFQTLGHIWSRDKLGFPGTSNTINDIREYVGDTVDEFINDYLAANPKK